MSHNLRVRSGSGSEDDSGGGSGGSKCSRFVTFSESEFFDGASHASFLGAPRALLGCSSHAGH
eukprot:12002618-Karenia_brevis.AAC.1